MSVKSAQAAAHTAQGARSTGGISASNASAAGKYKKARAENPPGTDNPLRTNGAHSTVVLNRGIAIVARPGIGIHVRILPHHAIVLPLPHHVSIGRVLTTLSSARLPTARTELERNLHYCGLTADMAEDIVEELLRAKILREHHQPPRITLLRSGAASERLSAALAREGIPAEEIPTTHRLIRTLPAGSVVHLPGTAFIAADLHYQLMQAGISHYPSAAIDGSVLLGPLVVPGSTPCLSCLDYHYTTMDGQWVSIRMQAAGRPQATDPLHIPAAAEITAGIIVHHFLPWMHAGAPTASIPPILTQRLEYRLHEASITRTSITRAPGCLSCQLAAGITPSFASLPSPAQQYPPQTVAP